MKLSHLKWYFTRWCNMKHPGEDVYRVKQQMQYHIFDKIKKNSPPKVPKVIYRSDMKKYHFYNIQKSSYRTYPIFDISIDLDQNIRWRKDYKNNIESDVKFCSNINYGDFSQIGETKYIFELNRFHHLPYLAYSYLKFNDEKVLCIIKNHINDWIDQNPFLGSVNWTSGIEVAIRVVNWIYTRKLLAKKINDKNFFEIFDQWIWYHYYYLVNHLSLYSSANNHFIAELLGIISVTCNYEFKNSEQQLNKFSKILENEIIKQTYSDGHNKEQSYRYHAASLNSIFGALLFLEQMGYFFKSTIGDRIYKMSQIIKVHLNENEEFVDYGDNDNSELLVNKGDPDYHLYYSLLTTAAIYFNDSSLLSDHSHYDFRNFLLFGDKGLIKYEELSNSYKINKGKISQYYNTTKIFPHSGYLFIKEDQSQLVFDFGEIGYNRIAAHGHSDLLHFIFSYKGIPFIVDTGTYQYNDKYYKWRKYFRSVKAHNTISIDDLDQAEQAGRMAWLKKPNIRDIDYNLNGDIIYCSATHTGFEKQGIPVLHKREILYNRAEKFYEINDTLISQNDHKASFFLHFSPYLENVNLNGDKVVLFKNGKRVIIKNDIFNNAELIKGNSSLPIGWFSPAYDKKIPTWTLKLDINFSKVLSLNTKITFYTKD